MLLEKALWILAFNVASLTSEVYGLDWPWYWKNDDVTHVKCYTTCLAAVRTGAILAVGFGAAGIGARPFAAMFMPMIAPFAARDWFAFLQPAGVYGIGTTDKMVLASTVSPLCAAICGKRQDLKCYTHRIDGMKGLDEYLIRAEQVKNIKQCEDQCNDDAACRAFRYLPRNSFCFLYKLQQFIEDDISESQFYVKRCILCYMNATKNAKGRDDEIQTVWEASSLKECEIRCIKTDDCGAVYFDGLRCFQFNTKTEPKENTGTEFSSKICVEFSDIALENDGLDWPWYWKNEDVTHVKCYTTCLAAVRTGNLAILAARFGAAGIGAGPFAAMFMPMIAPFAARDWFAFLQPAGVYGIGTTDKMVLASTVSPLCAAICGISEKRQGDKYKQNGKS